MTGPRVVPGGDPWLFAICLSRVGAYMVYIAYAATLPVLQRCYRSEGDGGRALRARLLTVRCRPSVFPREGFASFGLAGAGAVIAVIWLHRLPAARALTIGH